MNNDKNAAKGITEIKMFKNETFLMRCITIFINKICAIKKETNPILKGNCPEYIKNTSPKNEKIKPVVYHLFISETDLVYKNNSDNIIKGLNTYRRLSILKIIPVMSKTEIRINAKSAIFLIILKCFNSSLAIYNFCPFFLA